MNLIVFTTVWVIPRIVILSLAVLSSGIVMGWFFVKNFWCFWNVGGFKFSVYVNFRSESVKFVGSVFDSSDVTKGVCVSIFSNNCVIFAIFFSELRHLWFRIFDSILELIIRFGDIIYWVSMMFIMRMNFLGGTCTYLLSDLSAAYTIETNLTLDLKT